MTFPRRAEGVKSFLEDQKKRVEVEFGQSIFEEVSFSEVKNKDTILLRPADGSDGFVWGIASEVSAEKFTHSCNIASPPRSGPFVVTKDQTQWAIYRWARKIAKD